MVRTTVALLSIAVFAGFQAPVRACECPGCAKVAETGEGFCCDKGKAFGVELTSKELYDALVGHKMDLEKHPCPGCRNAGKHNGHCAHCGTYAVNGEVYHSPVAYALAKGKPMPKELVEACPKRCDGCMKAHATNGRCEKCNVGFVADRMYESKDDYESALAAYKTLEKAAQVATHCVGCAVAMVTDGTCDQCHVKFKDGKIARADG